MTDHARFADWFKQGTGHEPYPFQVRFARDPGLLSNPSPAGRGQGEGLLVDLPTVSGRWQIVNRPQSTVW